MLKKCKWKSFSTKMKKKRPSLWVIKEIKADGKIEIEKPILGQQN